MATRPKDNDKVYVFVSYSHDEDRRWFESGSLIPYLKNSLRREAVFWHDHGLEPGDVFRREIEEEIDRADLVILLISQGFLNSEFIEKVELPRIMDRAERAQLEVIPLLTHPCLWQELEFIARYQIVPGQPTPLIEYTGSSRDWARVKFETLKAVKSRIDRIIGKRKHEKVISATIGEEAPMWPSPTWPATDSARLWFQSRGLMHNYCILAKRRVLFGRSQERVDVRLYEVERCLANLQRQAKEGMQQVERSSGSCVGREHWLFEPMSNVLRVTQLSGSNLGVTTDGKKLRQGASHVLGRNTAIMIPGIIGLHYAANAPAFDALEDARVLACHILRGAALECDRSELWRGEYGGYRLSRLFSLTGAHLAGSENSQGLEAYVLAPGWLTLGSSPSACVVVPDGDVAPLQAGLFYIDGYFFLLSLTKGHSTLVDGQPLSADVPRPIAPGTEIRMGKTSVSFELFSQLFV